MKFLLTAFAALALLAPAKERLTAEKKASNFIRVDRSGEDVLLQPALALYEKDGVKVTLLGAVHIADKAYFTDLNTRFRTYDRLLFEMIGGDKLAEVQKLEAEGKKVDPSPLATAYKMISSFLKLAEYEKLQKERGESLLGFALEAAKNADTKNEPSTLALMTALISGNSNKAKLLLIEALAGGDEAMSGLVNPTVIITDRNAKALEVLAAEIKKGHKNLGIFYGAAHFPDLEKSLLKQGYKKTKQEWLTAWSVEKE
jgi:hypothetical protein